MDRRDGADRGAGDGEDEVGVSGAAAYHPRMNTTTFGVTMWLMMSGGLILAGLVACEKKPTQAAAPAPTAPIPASGPNSPTARVAPEPTAKANEPTQQPAKEATKEPVKAEPKASGPAATAASGGTGEMVGPMKVPAGWVLDATPKPMRVATYTATTKNGKVEVAVTKFPARVGGELANINRWRGQMGVAAVDAAGLEGVITRFSAEGFEGYETRIESSKGVMLATAVYEAANDQTWFVRVTAKDAAEADELQSAVFGMGRSVMEGKK